MSLTLGELNLLVSKLAPPAIAEPWDNVGLQAGDPEAAVKSALLALEVSPAVLDEAAAHHATAILCHHPLIFHPLKHLREDHPTCALLARLIRAEIGLIVAHTNLDKSTAGPNYALAAALGIRVERWLKPDRHSDYLKVVIFTPEGYENKMIEAIAAGGGGGIGNYSHCTFRAPGTGTFLPAEGANPFIGHIGKLEEARESRLETLVPRGALAEVLREVRLAHPYEEPAIDVIPVEIATSSSGLGIIGTLKQPVKLGVWREAAAKALRPLLPKAAQKGWEGPKITGQASRTVRRIAVCSGAGGSVIADAAEAGADCLLTGEVNHHQAIEAHALDLPLMCLGHFASEVAAMPFWARALEKETPAVEFFVAQRETDPLGWV